MRIEFHGLTFETPRITFYLWTPWRASALEHRLFEAMRNVLHAEPEAAPDELRLHVSDPHGYDAFGEPLSLWLFLRAGLDRGGPGEPEKAEDIDLEGFGLRIWGGQS